MCGGYCGPLPSCLRATSLTRAQWNACAWLVSPAHPSLRNRQVAVVTNRDVVGGGAWLDLLAHDYWGNPILADT